MLNSMAISTGLFASTGILLWKTSGYAARYFLAISLTAQAVLMTSRTIGVNVIRLDCTVMLAGKECMV